MPVKFLVNIAFLLFLFACSTSKVIKLNPAIGASKEFGSRSIFTEVINADTLQTEYARKLGIDSFVVGRLNYYPSSYTVYTSKIPVYSGNDQEFSNRNNMVISDTTEDIPFENFETDILFLYGKKDDGTYLVIADENNNRSFEDDSVYVFKNINQNVMVSMVGLDSFPHIKVDNVKSYYNKKIYTFSHQLVIEPILSVEQNNHDFKTALTLRVVSVQYYIGAFSYRGEKYKVAIRNALLPYLYYDPRMIKIKFAEATDTSAFQKISGKQPTYYIGDTVELGKYLFRIRYVSPLLKKIKLKPVNENNYKR